MLRPANNWLSRNSRETRQCQVPQRSRWRKRSSPARPYIMRFSVFSFVELSFRQAVAPWQAQRPVRRLEVLLEATGEAHQGANRTMLYRVDPRCQRVGSTLPHQRLSRQLWW